MSVLEHEVATRGPQARGDLAAVLDELLAHYGAPHGAAWTIRVDDTWAHADTETPMPVQGWKLHVSATVASVEQMLRACAPVLLDAGCSFKVARDLERVEALTGPHCPRGNGGKVLTAYPPDDAAAVRLAQRLDAATAGLPGPRILGDRPLRDGSLVHYRYGVFRGVPHLTHDGEAGAGLRTPDGGVIADRRDVGARPPAWVSCPFPQPVRSPEPAGHRPVLLGDRFAVSEAIRHANKGGVFRGTDTATGDRVVIKQARAHVGVDATGVDARARLRHEAAVLATLAGSGLVPELVTVIEKDGTDGDVFLVEQDAGPVGLRAWVSAGSADGIVTRSQAETRWMAARLATLLAGLHKRGVVVRDFSPNNLLVTDGGPPVLVDLETAVLPIGHPDLCAGSGTPAYGAPEQFAGAAPDPAADCFGLGATLLFLFTGEDPYLDPRAAQTLDAWLEHGVRREACPPDIQELARALCADDVARRPTAAAAAAAIVRGTDRPVPLTRHRAVTLALTQTDPLSTDTADAAIDALVSRLLRDTAPAGGRIARASSFGETTLATNVQHGAAGILGVLVQTSDALADPQVHARIREVADWLDRAVDRHPAHGPVGLYFGFSGPLWALADAGRSLGDDNLMGRSVERALALPADWPGPDVTHGLAGLGLTLVHLWELTGDERLAARVAEIGRHLVDTAEVEGPHISWRTPRTAASAFAGRRYHGFAHGTAGIGHFLDCAARVTGSARLRSAAAHAAGSLALTAIRADGTALWNSGFEDPDQGIWHWCNGSSGVATFLLYHAEGGGDVDPRLLDAAARGIVANKWRSGIAYCHGLSGDADLLLDYPTLWSGPTGGLDPAAVVGPYRAWAGDLLRLMWERRTTDEHGVGLTDEPGRITPDFNVGYGGALSALLRWRYGGRRLWLPNPAAAVRVGAR